MSKNIPSIAELLKQDQLVDERQSQQSPPGLELVAKPADELEPPKKKRTNKSKPKAKVEKATEPEAKPFKRSFSLPSHLEERFILALAKRRIAKKPYKINDIIEEAVSTWLESNP